MRLLGISYLAPAPLIPIVRGLLNIRSLNDRIVGSTVLQSQSFGYADASRLDTVTMGSDEVSYGYLTNSPQVSTVTFQHNGATVMTTSKTYDYANRLTNIASVTATGTVSSHTYDHTPLNQRNRADLADGTHWVYQYNSKGEVTNGTRYDASNNALSGQNYGYTYDGIGNRLTRLIDGGVASSYTSNKLNQYTAITGTGAASPTHDFDGNLTNNGTNIFEYDGENRLRVIKRSSGAVLVATYTYDDQSRRIRTVTTASAPQGVTDIVYAWHGWNLVGELANANGTLAPIRYHSWGLDLSGSEQGSGGVGGLLVQKDVASGEVYYPGYDSNGNLMILVNGSDGSVAASYTYDPFGRSVASSGTYANSNPFRFSTKFFTSEAGLYYYGYRFYDPVLGRWINRDPIEEMGGKILYGFCSNDALNKRDKLGLKDEWHHLLQSAVFTAERLAEWGLEDLNINEKQWGWEIDAGAHRLTRGDNLHAAGWRDAWETWIATEKEGNRKPTLCSIKKQLEVMKSDPKFQKYISVGKAATKDYSSWRGSGNVSIKAAGVGGIIFLLSAVYSEASGSELDDVSNAAKSYFAWIKLREGEFAVGYDTQDLVATRANLARQLAGLFPGVDEMFYLSALNQLDNVE